MPTTTILAPGYFVSAVREPDGRWLYDVLYGDEFVTLRAYRTLRGAHARSWRDALSRFPLPEGWTYRANTTGRSDEYPVEVVDPSGERFDAWPSFPQAQVGVAHFAGSASTISYAYNTSSPGTVTVVEPSSGRVLAEFPLSVIDENGTVDVSDVVPVDDFTVTDDPQDHGTPLFTVTSDDPEPERPHDYFVDPAYRFDSPGPLHTYPVEAPAVWNVEWVFQRRPREMFHSTPACPYANLIPHRAIRWLPRLDAIGTVCTTCFTTAIPHRFDAVANRHVDQWEERRPNTRWFDIEWSGNPEERAFANGLADAIADGLTAERPTPTRQLSYTISDLATAVANTSTVYRNAFENLSNVGNAASTIVDYERARRMEAATARAEAIHQADRLEEVRQATARAEAALEADRLARTIDTLGPARVTGVDAAQLILDEIAAAADAPDEDDDPDD